LAPFAGFFLFFEEVLRATRALAPFPFSADGLGEGRFFLLSDFLAKLNPPAPAQGRVCPSPRTIYL
jgi:hypothetical protein